MEPLDGMHEIARLEAIARGEGGALALPALAQAYRRADRPEEAERVAREGVRRLPDQPAARVALGLVLLDQGRAEEARSELERVLDANPDHAVARAAMPMAEPSEAELAEVEDAELDQAFAVAEAHRDEMLDADGVAAEALRAVEGEAGAEPARVRVAVAEPEPPAPPVTPTFQTATMAELLERQGHSDAARNLRASLDEAAAVTASAPETNRDRTVTRLENWLQNLRKAR